MTATLAPPAIRQVLIIGCGRDHRRILIPDDDTSEVAITTLDMNPEIDADIVWDLEQHPLPFFNEQYDELHAYDVLEHIGRQGDWKGFFTEFAEYWRILKPGGTFHITVPTGEYRFCDPGHTRFFNDIHFTFLSQKCYEHNISIGSQQTDYRWFWKRDFDVAYIEQNPDKLCVVLRKV